MNTVRTLQRDRKCKNYQTEVITEIRKLEQFNSRIDKTEALISELEDRAMENIQTEYRMKNN